MRKDEMDVHAYESLIKDNLEIELLIERAPIDAEV